MDEVGKNFNWQARIAKEDACEINWYKGWECVFRRKPGQSVAEAVVESRKVDHDNLVKRAQDKLDKVRAEKEKHGLASNSIFTTDAMQYGSGESVEMFKQITTVPAFRSRAKDLMPANADMGQTF